MRKKITLLIIKKQFFFSILLMWSAVLQAGPKITLKSLIVDAGTTVEGTSETLKFRFTFKNSGTSPLHIYKTVPSCGCTKIIRFDSLVMQSKSGTIDGELNLKNFDPGPLSKVITVFSSADTDSILKIAVKAIVRSLIEIREPYISVNGSDSARKSVEVLSRNNSLKITCVTFRRDPNGSASGRSHWQSDMPIPVSFNWMKVDTLRNDNYTAYRLTLMMPPISESMLGMFRIQTSHPEKPELFLPGTLLK